MKPADKGRAAGCQTPLQCSCGPCSGASIQALALWAAAPWAGSVGAVRAGTASEAHSTDTGGREPACWCKMLYSWGTEPQNKVIWLITLEFVHKVLPLTHGTEHIKPLQWQRETPTSAMLTCRQPDRWTHGSPAAARASSLLGFQALWCMGVDSSCTATKKQTSNTSLSLPHRFPITAGWSLWSCLRPHVMSLNKSTRRMEHHKHTSSVCNKAPSIRQNHP